LAPLDPTGTDRIFVDYTVAGHQHTILCRFKTPATAQDAADQVRDLLQAYDTELYASSLVTIRQADSGSGVTYPFTGTFISTWGSGTAAGNETAAYYDIVGRGHSGRRARVAVFGAKVENANDIFRLPYSLGGEWAAAIDVMVSSSNVFIDISGDQPLWHQYINIGVNAYWRNKLR
jgi:hypothetical protein